MGVGSRKTGVRIALISALVVSLSGTGCGAFLASESDSDGTPAPDTSPKETGANDPLLTDATTNSDAALVDGESSTDADAAVLGPKCPAGMKELFSDTFSQDFSDQWVLTGYGPVGGSAMAVVRGPTPPVLGITRDVENTYGPLLDRKSRPSGKGLKKLQLSFDVELPSAFLGKYMFAQLGTFSSGALPNLPLVRLVVPSSNKIVLQQQDGPTQGITKQSPEIAIPGGAFHVDLIVDFNPRTTSLKIGATTHDLTNHQIGNNDNEISALVGTFFDPNIGVGSQTNYFDNIILCSTQ